MTNNMQSLVKIARVLNSSNITWALGGSMLLLHHGFNVNPDDIDILVDSKDQIKLDEVIRSYNYTYSKANDQYATKHFYNIEIDGVWIDIMIDFKVKTNQGIYSFPFNKNLIEETLLIENDFIYLSSIKEWKKAYTAMDRKDKIQLFKENNI